MRVSYYKLPQQMVRYAPPVRPLIDPQLIPPRLPPPPMMHFENYLADDTNYFVMGFISACVIMALLK